MPSSSYTHAFVWVWLPDATEPVVAGKLSLQRGNLIFNYGKSYLERNNAIPIYDKELPLKAGELPLLAGLKMPGCIRDAAPDAWGRRVIINKKLGLKDSNLNIDQLDELTYLLESGSDRIGALDFQLSATDYEPRSHTNANLEELLELADRVEKGMPITPELDQAIHHGSSVGGARPKALIENNNKKYISKFSASNDLYSFVKGEFIAMRLAKMAGLNAAEVKLVKASHKDVLLIKRFDRIASNGSWQRKSMISALTMLALDEMTARYASYEDLAEIIRHKFSNPKNTLKELFSRIVFNILCGNTDDHARNHAAFWDGKMLTLTPAYDICPYIRSGNEATQAMLISGNNRKSKITSCLEVAENFLLTHKEAVDIVANQIEVITKNWNAVCEEAELTPTDKKLFQQRSFLNPYIFEGLEGEEKKILEHGF